MAEHPLNESAFSRALGDTIGAQRTLRFMWGGEGVLAVAGGAWLSALAPQNASIMEIVVRAVVGGLRGIFATCHPPTGDRLKGTNRVQW